MIAIAIVVTVYTAGATAEGGSFGTTAAIVGGIAGGAAGSLASQLAGNAFGVQSGISWQGVLEGAVGGGIGGAFAASNVFGDLAPTLQAGLKVATANTLTQEVGIALHWQHGLAGGPAGLAGRVHRGAGRATLGLDRLGQRGTAALSPDTDCALSMTLGAMIRTQ